MSYVIVTLEITSKQRVDLALPINIPNHVLGPAIAKALEMEEDELDTYLLSVKAESGIMRLSPDTTLAEAGVLDGFVLQFHRKQITDSKPASTEKINTVAFLQAETGEIFPLNAESISVGRRDTKRGSFVDVDLTPLDTGKIVSRRHAVIEQQGGKFVLKDQDSVNGTWVNNERIDSGEPRTLRSGDMITFGRNGVRLRFEKE